MGSLTKRGGPCSWRVTQVPGFPLSGHAPRPRPPLADSPSLLLLLLLFTTTSEALSLLSLSVVLSIVWWWFYTIFLFFCHPFTWIFLRLPLFYSLLKPHYTGKSQWPAKDNVFWNVYDASAGYCWYLRVILVPDVFQVDDFLSKTLVNLYTWGWMLNKTNKGEWEK